MVHFQITTGTGVPSYRQLMDQVMYYVASGTLKPGDGLPSIRELAGRLSVNPSTVVKAYNDLSHGGVIELRHGKGAFVSNGGRKLPLSEMKKALRAQARKLAVDATQMGVPGKVVLELLREEMDGLEKRAGNE